MHTKNLSNNKGVFLPVSLCLVTWFEYLLVTPRDSIVDLDNFEHHDL